MWQPFLPAGCPSYLYSVSDLHLLSEWHSCHPDLIMIGVLIGCFSYANLDAYVKKVVRGASAESAPQNIPAP